MKRNALVGLAIVLVAWAFLWAVGPRAEAAETCDLSGIDAFCAYTGREATNGSRQLYCASPDGAFFFTIQPYSPGA